MRITSNGTSITLPLSAGARDPLSALFYVRTLVDQETRLSLPISDNGRRVRLDINGSQPETLVVGGRSWSALRLEPRLSDRIERGPLTVTAWVSADARRVPLLVEVSAGFGRVRLELTTYRER